MSGTEWLVVAAGAGAIAWVNWYFFRAGRVAPATAAPTGGGAAEATIVVRGGYTPSAIRAKAGQPLRLVFDRQDDSSCSEEIVLPDFGIRRYLPTGAKTAIEVTPPRAGRYEFTCGMGMLHGALVVED
ncbi:MAG TPA: cupredoxin domain-containing protein [Gemmatimonadaceae bacterium]|nr:cupredoxin domain-containing protein [Gemmatimonadaceae bacterium]HEX2778212.1 cupredoxin domain-containing protein [Gemmatimonadaceae bacterium]